MYLINLVNSILIVHLDYTTQPVVKYGGAEGLTANLMYPYVATGWGSPL